MGVPMPRAAGTRGDLPQFARSPCGAPLAGLGHSAAATIGSHRDDRLSPQPVHTQQARRPRHDRARRPAPLHRAGPHGPEARDARGPAGQDAPPRRGRIRRDRELRRRGRRGAHDGRGREARRPRLRLQAPVRGHRVLLGERHGAARRDAPDQARARRAERLRIPGPQRQGALRRLRPGGPAQGRGVRRLHVAEAWPRAARAQDLVREGLRALGLGRRLRHLPRRRRRRLLRGAAEAGRRHGDHRVRRRSPRLAHRALPLDPDRRGDGGRAQARARRPHGEGHAGRP